MTATRRREQVVLGKLDEQISSTQQKLSSRVEVEIQLKCKKDAAVSKTFGMPESGAVPNFGGKILDDMSPRRLE